MKKYLADTGTPVMSISRYSDYDNIAWVYNKYWGNKFLSTATLALERFVLSQVPLGALILDLCCGTGQLANALSELGYRVTGIDGSEEMLKFAHKNAPCVNLILDDARTFTLPPTFHLAISMFDSLNHILSPGELTTAFSNVHRALLEGGLFLFDLNMAEGYKTSWNGFFGIIEDDHVCVTRNSYNQKSRIAKFEATVFRLEGHWRRSDVSLTERCYSEVEVRSALEVAGFINVVAYGYKEKSGFTQLTRKSERAFFVCRNS